MNSAGSIKQPSPALARVLAFLAEIGLPWQFSPGARGFIPLIDIKDGVLLVDPEAPVSGVLHEAGHLATLPGDFRLQAQSNLAGVLKHMFETIDFSNPDGELQRAAIQCSDPEATAWAWAAGEHLGFAPEEIIQDHEYDGDGAFLRMQLMQRQYLGIHGLAHAGFCAIRESTYSRARGMPVYPKLARWLQRTFQ